MTLQCEFFVIYCFSDKIKIETENTWIIVLLFNSKCSPDDDIKR